MPNYRKALKNYTTNAQVGKMLNDIQQMLADAGATAVSFQYTNGKVSGIMFGIRLKEGENPVGTVVPLLTENVAQVLKTQRYFKNDDHAYRVAIANVRDWLDAQLAMLATQQVKIEQLFLPYMQTSTGKTVYELVKEQNVLGLPQGN